MARRVVNPKAIELARKPRCEVCGARAYGEPHHIITRGAGGPDIPENLIQLCWQCHYGEVPSGRLPKARLFAIIARRERKTPEEIEDIVYRARRTGVYG
jgi:5-methylcytosine-specific restriction endonuclease McrA